MVNAASPALRYYAAVTKDYPLMAVSSFAVGSVYGVIGAWPPLLARLLFPNSPGRWTLITAIASLANYAGGAVGTTLLPAIIRNGTLEHPDRGADDLLHVLEVQVYVGAALGVMLLSWLWIPPVPHPAPSTLRARRLVCAGG